MECTRCRCGLHRQVGMAHVDFEGYLGNCSIVHRSCYHSYGHNRDRTRICSHRQVGGGILHEPLLHLLVWMVVEAGLQGRLRELVVVHPVVDFLVVEVVGLSVALLVGLLQVVVDLPCQGLVLVLLADLVLSLLAEQDLPTR